MIICKSRNKMKEEHITTKEFNFDPCAVKDVEKEDAGESGVYTFGYDLLCLEGIFPHGLQSIMFVVKVTGNDIYVNVIAEIPEGTDYDDLADCCGYAEYHCDIDLQDKAKIAYTLLANT